jgi:hypothetical protein
MKNIELYKQFAKDYKIPIPVIDAGYFIKSLTLIDFSGKYLEALMYAEKWMSLTNSTVDDFKKEIKTVIEKIVDKLSERVIIDPKVYDAPNIQEKYGIKYSQSLNVYNRNSVGNSYISLDLIHANEQALEAMGVLDSCESWDSLVFDFTQNENKEVHDALYQYIKNSKQIRQVTFGKINAKMQRKVEKWLVECVIDNLIENKILDSDDFIGYTTDEIILKDTEFTRKVVDDVEIASTKLGRFSIDKFTIKQIGDFDFFVKVRCDKYPSFHNIPITYYMQAVKYYFGQPITDDDLRFIYEGHIAKFEKPLFY